jgi:hypothetical protein
MSKALTLEVDGVAYPARVHLLWWQERGLSFTASGYGRRVPTTRMVHVDGRWRRVYCCVFSNSGTCYIDGPKGADGKRPWRVVH